MITEEKRERNRLKNIEWRKKNPEKYRQAVAIYREKHPNKLAEYKLKTRYGISREKYIEMLTLQSGCCAICGEEETATHNQSKKLQKLAVDHCHFTGIVRGLLCKNCNRALGLFQEDISNLKSAIKYLEQYENSMDS